VQSRGKSEFGIGKIGGFRKIGSTRAASLVDTDSDGELLTSLTLRDFTWKHFCSSTGRASAIKESITMGKLLGGLGLCLVLGTAQQALAQDPFTTPSYEPAGKGETASFFQVQPPKQTEPEGPIIHTIPTTRPKPVYNQEPLKSRTQNAYLRTIRTPAQEYIHHRAVFQAQQRNHRMEQRKWQGVSLLRPDNRRDDSWYYGYHVPVMFPSY
jgi:hypothetical protein